MRRAVPGILGALAATVVVSEGVRAGEREPLALEAVIESAQASFPLLQAVGLERIARESAERRALGAFDTRLGVEGDVRPQGFYENYAGAASLDQQTTLWGARAYARYRYGTGEFPSYDADRLTNDAGEVALGLEVPLLRGGAIDEERAALRSSRIRARSFGPELELEQIEVVRDASLAYWAWVAAGETVEVAERLLRAAEVRQDQIAGRVEAGSEPEIDLVDNERLVLERRNLVRGAQRDLRQAAVALSLYYRDPSGDPVVPRAAELPTAFPDETPLGLDTVESDLERARNGHPLLRKLDLERERLEVEAKLAGNRVLPSLDLRVEGSRDFGDPEPGIDSTGKLSADPRGDTEVKALVRMELPIQLREARGRLGVARVRLAQLERRRRFAEERLVADVRIAVEALHAAFDQTGQARDNARLAMRMRDAELRRLEAGLSNLLAVNIREVQAATAERQLVQAQAAYFRALADYRASVALPFAAPDQSLSTHTEEECDADRDLRARCAG